MAYEPTAEMRKVVAMLKESGSSWIPISTIADMDISKNVEDGNLVVKKYCGKKYVTVPYYAQTEKMIANFIFPRVMSSTNVDLVKVEQLIHEYEDIQSNGRNKRFEFSDEQVLAIKNMLSHNFAITTGGPGTGKTSIIQCTIFIIKKLHAKGNLVISLTAPTGKAAKRMTEATGLPATTLQMFTGGIDGTPIKRKGPQYLFVDEFSMADEEVLRNMARSLLPYTRVFLFGDSNQLPSVGIGAVLKDLMNCDEMPVVQLVKTFRQDNSSKLFSNIKIIERGGHVPLETGSDFECIRTEKNILDVSVEKYMENVKRFGADNTVILTAYRKEGAVCSEKLNERIQKLLNPSSNGKPAFSTKVERDPGRWINVTYKEGDPVIQLRNTTLVANGEVGKIISVKDAIVSVLFPTGVVTYKGKQLKDLDLAYALSVHKSQGSEYACVVFPVLRTNKNLSRNLIYTAVSRAKQHCIVIGEDETIVNACKVQSDWDRITFLREEYAIQRRALQIRSSIFWNHQN